MIIRMYPRMIVLEAMNCFGDSFVTDHVRSTREGNIFTYGCDCVHIRWGIPSPSQVGRWPNLSQPYPTLTDLVLAGGWDGDTPWSWWGGEILALSGGGGTHGPCQGVHLTLSRGITDRTRGYSLDRTRTGLGVNITFPHSTYVGGKK